MTPEQTVRIRFLLAGIDDMADIVKNGNVAYCSDLPGKIKSCTAEIAKILDLKELLVNSLEN